MRMIIFILWILTFLFDAADATREPTRYPTQRPSEPIYGDFVDSVGLSSTAAQVIMAVLIVLLFAGMIFDVQAPEILFLGAVCVTFILQIVTLDEALSGVSLY